tara:strand:+ start:3841 stop:5682 length:1842 start_codon:yes stop_codon:yes gene_type:complete
MRRTLGLIVLAYVLSFSLPSFADYEFITEAEILVVDSATPPLELALWRQTFLPRSWSIDPAHPKDTRTAWYRITLPEDLQRRQWDHILMLRHILNVEIWLDDRFIGSGGPVSEPIEARLQRNWNRPILLSMHDALTQTSAPRYLYIRLLSEPAYGVMSPVIIGTESSLRPWYRISYFVQITLVQISLAALLFTGLLSLFIWIKMRQRSWLLLTLMSAIWSLPLLYIILPTIPSGEFSGLRVVHWAVVAGATALLAFIDRFYLGGKNLRLDLLALIPLSHALILALVPNPMIVTIGNTGQILCQLLFIFLIVRLLRSPHRHSAALYWVVVGLAIMLLAVLHDVTLFTGSNTERWRWDTPLSYITQPIMLLILAWNGVRVFLSSARELGVANAVLQGRLEESEQRIRQLYLEQERLEREQRVEAERELVYRDLHDDLGARLLSLVYQSEKGEAQDLARTALQDLRDIVSRVLSSSQALSAVLADSLAEQFGRAQALGKDIDWDLDSSLDDIACQSTTTLGLRMLMRELMGACLRLERVERLRVAMSWNDDNSTLSIAVQHDARAENAYSEFAVLPVLQKRLRVMHATLSSSRNLLLLELPITRKNTGNADASPDY